MKTIKLLIAAAMVLLPLPLTAQELPAAKPDVKGPDTTNGKADNRSADEAIDDAKGATNAAIEAAKEAIIKAIDKAKEHTSSALKTGKEATEGALDKATEATRILDKAAKAAREVLDAAKHAAGAVLDKAKDAAEDGSKADKPAEPETKPAPSDGDAKD